VSVRTYVEGAILAFAWYDWEKHWKTSVRMVIHGSMVLQLANGGSY